MFEIANVIEVARVRAVEVHKANKNAHIRLPSVFQYGMTVFSKDSEVGKNVSPATIPIMELNMAIFPGYLFEYNPQNIGNTAAVAIRSAIKNI